MSMNMGMNEWVNAEGKRDCECVIEQGFWG